MSLRRRLTALLAAVALLVPGATPAQAWTYNGTCASTGFNYDQKIFVYKPRTELAQGFYLKEAYGEIVVEYPDPCDGGGLDGTVAVLPANIQGTQSGQIVQLGLWMRSGWSLPQFVKTAADNGGGSVESVNAGGQLWQRGGPGFPSGGTGAVETPQSGHRYYFWLRTVNNLYWRYEIMDITDGQKWWRDETAHWTNGDVIWWGYEWFNLQDRITYDHYIDDLRYKTNDGEGWYWRTQTTAQIRVQCGSGHCTFDQYWHDGDYHHWDAFMNVSDQGYGGNRLRVLNSN